eukprot:Skav214239  [mRNA]  locus=scaffold1133:180276:182484:- [translate_table: standard]
MVDTMCDSAVRPNAVTFGGLLHALGQGGGWLKAIQCFERLPKLALETNVILINTALADSRSRKRWRFGLNLLSAGVSDRVLLDIVSFNSALVVSGHASWQYGLSMLEQVQKSGLRSDIITCNSSIQCSVDGSSWRHALYFCGTWGPNLSGFNAAVSGLAKAQEWQQAAASVFQLANAERCAPDLRSFHALGSAIAQKDFWASSLQLLIKVDELNVKTDAVLGNMFCSSSRRSDWQNSLLVPALFFRRSIEPDSVTCSSLASAHAYVHQWRHALMLLEPGSLGAHVMDVNDMAYIRSICLDGCAKRFAWEAASILVGDQNRKDDGDSVDAAYLAAIEGQSKALQWLRSVQQLEDLNCYALRQNVLMYSALTAGAWCLETIFFGAWGCALQSASSRHGGLQLCGWAMRIDRFLESVNGSPQGNVAEKLVVDRHNLHCWLGCGGEVPVESLLRDAGELGELGGSCCRYCTFGCRHQVLLHWTSLVACIGFVGSPEGVNFLGKWKRHSSGICSCNCSLC